jgi:hypothetical protein
MTAEPLHAEHQPTEHVVSRDGTRIGYRQVGVGPGLVLVQGAMGTMHNFSELAPRGPTTRPPDPAGLPSTPNVNIPTGQT